VGEGALDDQDSGMSRTKMQAAPSTKQDVSRAVCVSYGTKERKTVTSFPIRHESGRLKALLCADETLGRNIDAQESRSKVRQRKAPDVDTWAAESTKWIDAIAFHPAIAGQSTPAELDSRDKLRPTTKSRISWAPHTNGFRLVCSWFEISKTGAENNGEFITKLRKKEGLIWGWLRTDSVWRRRSATEEAVAREHWLASRQNCTNQLKRKMID
jgi:hypothetical protein